MITNSIDTQIDWLSYDWFKATTGNVEKYLKTLQIQEKYTQTFKYPKYQKNLPQQNFLLNKI